MEEDYYDPTQRSYGKEANSAKKENHTISLLPVNSAIIRKAEKDQYGSHFTFKGIPISTVVLCGNIIDYKEEVSRVKFTLFDFGTVQATIHDDKVLEDFTYDGGMPMVEIVGTLNNYKDDRLVQVSSIQNIDEDDYVFHILKTIDDWSFLEGHQEEASKIQNAEAAMDAKSIAETGRFSSSDSLFERAENLVINYFQNKGNNTIYPSTLRSNLKAIAPEGKISEIIEHLIYTAVIEKGKINGEDVYVIL